MTRISRFKLNPKQLKHLFNELWEAITDLDDPKPTRTFLEPFFSPTETLMFAKRLEILKRLRQDQPYEKIMQDLKVTPGTIAKMNNVLHLAKEEFLDILDDLIKDQKKRREK